MSIERIIAVGAAILVVAGLALGFALLGTPAHVRDQAIDRATIADLNRRILLEDLDINAPSERPRKRIVCATFRLASSGSDANLDWPHPAGRACFEFQRGAATPRLVKK